MSLLTAIGLYLLHAVYGSLVTAPASAQDFVADPHQPRHIKLEDGSRLDLQAGSEVTLEDLQASRRLEVIRGEALFTIKHNPSRPVDVAAGDTLVQVLGTQFDVRLQRTETTVTVIDGAVEVLRLGDRKKVAENKIGVKLYGSQRIVIGPDSPFGSTTQLTAAEARSTLKWNLKFFPEVTVGTLVEELNGYNVQPKIVVQDPSVGMDKIGGTFPISDPYEVIEKVQAVDSEVRVQQRSDAEIVLARRGQRGH